MRKLYGGRVRPVPVSRRLLLPPLSSGRRSVATTIASSTVPAGGSGAVSAAMGRVDRESRCFHALETLVRELVEGEMRSFENVEDDGSLVGGMQARLRARALALFSRQGGTPVAAWSQSLGELVGRLAESVVVPGGSGEVVRVTVPLIGLIEDPRKLSPPSSALPWPGRVSVVSCGLVVGWRRRSKTIC